MKVKELIKKLQKMDPNARVLVEGYEIGYDDASSPEEIVVRETKGSWYDGKFQTWNDVMIANWVSDKDTTAVLIGREHDIS